MSQRLYAIAADLQALGQQRCAGGCAMIITSTCVLRRGSVSLLTVSGGRRADTPMPVRESEALILRSFPLGEADRLVSFLSRNEGRIRGVASGARRTKSRFGSTLEPFSYVRMWFYERETRELVRINQCELIESFLEAQRDYAVSLALALMSEVTEAVLGDHEVAEPNFRLLLLIARAIKAGAKLPMALAYFAFWTVRLGGWMPALDRCSRCGAVLNDRASMAKSGFFCSNCTLAGQRAISQETLKMARRMVSGKLEDMIKENFNAAATEEIKDHMLNLIEQHIEKKLHTRRMFADEPEPLT
jgi:DNA repair protein RecO (recombination protein O)